MAVIRLSGPDTVNLVRAIAGNPPPSRQLALRAFRHPISGEALDTGLVAVFPAPRSFTGEDCAELHAHGSPATVKALLAALAATGKCRLAEAGEFTRRAFENGKLDLTEIEGLGDLLAADTEAQRRQALARLEGGLSQRALAWRSTLVGLRAEIEAHLDFSDEDDVPDELSQSFWLELEALAQALRHELARFAQGRIIREGFRVVLYGAPNVGKSSLLNVLAGSEVAIVTDEAGTTRDLKEVAVDIAGHKLVFVDTAGLRETESKAEAAGIALSRSAAEAADLVLWLSSSDVPSVAPPETKAVVWRVATKADLNQETVDGLPVSTLPGGTSRLIAALAGHIENMPGSGEAPLISHERDRLALGEALEHLNIAVTPGKSWELVAEDLRAASDSLARLIGLVDAEEVLDRLFQGFCIGK